MKKLLILLAAFLVTWDIPESYTVVPCPNEFWIKISTQDAKEVQMIKACVMKSTDHKTKELPNETSAKEFAEFLKMVSNVTNIKVRKK